MSPKNETSAPDSADDPFSPLIVPGEASEDGGAVGEGGPPFDPADPFAPNPPGAQNIPAALVGVALPVPGYPGFRASAGGVIFGPRGPLLRVHRPRRDASLDSDPYPEVRILDPLGRRVYVRVQTLVALAWLGPCPAGKILLRTSAAREDCSIGSLAYGYRAQVLRRPWSYGRVMARAGSPLSLATAGALAAELRTTVEHLLATPFDDPPRPPRRPRSS